MEDFYKQKHILLVDDEESLVMMVVSILKEEGYTHISTAYSCKEAKERCNEQLPDFVILDVMLPDGNGFSFMQYFKQIGDIPVLFLSAQGEDEDKLKGFDVGGDDYVVKPFLPKELTSRIAAILKRSYKHEDTIVVLDGCLLDFSRAQVRKDNIWINLTAKEFAILSILYRNAGRIVTMDALCEAAWGENPFGYENSLMTHIRRIREKIEKQPSRPTSLITVKGLGYKLLIKGNAYE